MNLGLYGYGPPRDRTWLVVDFGVAFAGAGPARRRPHLSRHLPTSRRSAPTLPASSSPTPMRIISARCSTSGRGSACRSTPPPSPPACSAPSSRASRAREPVPVDRRRAGQALHGRPVRGRVHQRRALDPGIATRSRSARRSALVAPHRRLEARRRRRWSALPTDVAAAPRDRRRGRARARLRFHQRDARGPQPERGRGRRASSPRSSRGRQARVAFTTFASNVGRIRSIALAAAGGRARGGGRRPRHAPGHRRRRASSACSKALPPFLDEEAYGHLPRDKVVALLTGSQGEPRAALARVADERPPQRRARAGRHGGLFVPRHPRQRDRDQPHHQPLDRPRRPGDHRPRRLGPRLRPSAPRRAARDVSLAQAEGRRAGARRGDASRRACRARARRWASRRC